jgi:hypothetical protein
LTPGTILRARIKGPSPDADWLTLKIQSCTQEASQWVVTYSVVGWPSAQLLQSFHISTHHE